MTEEIIERVPTGIPGLDDMIEGGLERNSNILVVGGCGSGKSTLGVQFLYNGATEYDENGVYATFEEQSEKIKKHMMRFGWDLDKLEEEGKLKIIRIKPINVLKMIKESYGEIVTAIQEINAKRVVIDSITSIESMIKDEHERKENSIQLCEWLSNHGCTSMIISESEQTLDQYSRHGTMEFIADGVVVLYNIQKGNTIENALCVLKMRGTKHLKKIVPFNIDKGITVFPHEQVFSEMR